MSTAITTTKSNSKLRQKNQISNVQDKHSSSPLIIKTDKVLNVKNKKNKKELQIQEHNQQQQQKPIVKLPFQKRPSASAPTTPQQQRKNILPVKARRVERRKEIKSLTAEAIKTETDSSSSSDDSSSDSNKTPSISKHKKKGNNNKNMNNRPTPSVTTVTLKKSQHALQQQQQQRTRRRSSSAVDLRGTVYAGPTFNNAPLPSALPIPAFSPTLVSNDLLKKQQQLQRHSQDLMNILSSPQQTTTTTTTSHFERDLSEIQRGLRSMLKI